MLLSLMDIDKLTHQKSKLSFIIIAGRIVVNGKGAQYALYFGPGRGNSVGWMGCDPI